MGARGHRESTIYRLARGTGFNARVEPIWHNVTRLRRSLGIIQYMRERVRVKRLVSKVNGQLKAWGLDPGGWDTPQGRCVVNLRIEKFGVLEDLRSFVRQDAGGGLAERSPHLLNHRERNAYYVPLDFDRPFLLGREPDAIPIGSSIRLRKELQEIEEVLHVKDSLSADKMVDYLHASQSDITRYESEMLTDPMFWTKFGCVLLTKVARTSAETGLPVVFA